MPKISPYNSHNHLQLIQAHGIKRFNLKPFPATLQTSPLQKIKINFADNFFIFTLVYLFVMVTVNLEAQLLGPYYQVQFPLMIIPILSFTSFMYYFTFSYYFNHNATIFNHWYQSKIIPLEYLTDPKEENFDLSLKESLARSLAHFINCLFLFIPSLTTLIDPYQRSFADLFSHTITVSNDDFIQIFQNKTHRDNSLQLEIDIQKIYENQNISYDQVA